MDSSNLAYDSFLIRLWRKMPDEGEEATPRSESLLQVEHILNGEKRYFSSLGAFCKYLQEQLTPPEDMPMEDRNGFSTDR